MKTIAEMASPERRTRKASSQGDVTSWRYGELASMRTIEMVFFVHMQMADPADQILASSGLGRPHHRVMYFAGHKPGINVKDLTSLLRISNQALSRTTNHLVAMGLLEQRYSREDRRVRQHFLTPKGASLLTELTRPQLAMISEAQKKLTATDIETFWRVLEVMARSEDLAWLSPHPLSPSDAQAGVSAGTPRRSRGTHLKALEKNLE